jgi:hypothetical protein
MWWFGVALAEAGCPPKPDGAVRLVLVGDAGRAEAGDAVLAAAAGCAVDAEHVLVLGDNVYAEPMGFRPWRILKGNLYGGLRRDHAVGRGQLDAQLGAFDAVPELLVLPGNHDWYAGRAGLTRERDYVTRSPEDGGEAHATWFAPFVGDDPCDVLVGVRTHPGVTVLGVDSMAQLRCGARARDLVRDRVHEATSAGGWLVLAAHHPVATVGKHTGHNLSGQDVDGSRYRHRWTSVLVGLSEDELRRTIVVSGHDHLLALLPGREHVAMQIVSGTGSESAHVDAAADLKGVTDADRVRTHRGFVVLDLVGATATATLVDVEQGDSVSLEVRR